MRARPPAVAALALLLAACGAAAQATTSLRMAGNVADASVTIDDQYVGALVHVARHGVALPPGRHRITVEKTGYFAWDRVVDAPGGGRLELDVVLTKIPD